MSEVVGGIGEKNNPEVKLYNYPEDYISSEDFDRAGVRRGGAFVEEPIEIRPPGVSFLDEMLLNWSNETKLFGGALFVSANRIFDDAIDEEIGTLEEREGWIDVAIDPFREAYLGNAARKHLTYSNGTFWDKVKTFGAELFSPEVIAAGLATDPIFNGIGRAVSLVTEASGRGAYRFLRATTEGLAEETFTKEMFAPGTVIRGIRERKHKKEIFLPDILSAGDEARAIKNAASIVGKSAKEEPYETFLYELGRDFMSPSESALLLFERTAQKVAKGAAEGAIFEGVLAGEKEIVGIPAENIGDNILASALLGGVVGGAAAALTRKKYLGELNRQMVYPEETFKPVIAAEKEKPTLMFKGSKGGESYVSLPKVFQIGPLAQSWSSKNALIRQMSEAYFGNMYEHSEIGGMASITDIMQSDRGTIAKNVIEYKKHFERYRKEFKGSKNKAKEAFEQEFANAAIEGGSTLNPIISGYVTKVREIFKDYGKRAVDAKLLNEAILAKEYFPQYYDKIKISKDMEGFKESLKNGLKSQNPHLATDTKEAFYELQSIANEIVDNVYWDRVAEKETLAIDGSPLAESLKKRGIKFNQRYLRDYLITDPLQVVDRYVSAVGFNIAEKVTLNRLGYENKEAVIASIRGWEGSASRLENEKLFREMGAIVSGQFDANTRKDFDRALGGSWARQTIGAFQDLNISRYLGGLAIAGAVDLAANAAKGTTCKHIAGLINYKALKGLTRDELHAMGFAIDDITSEIRMISQESVLDDLPSKLGNAIAKFRDNVTKPLAEMVVTASGIKTLDAVRERVSAVLNILDISKEILSGKKQIKKLDYKTIKAIKGQIEKYATFDKDGSLEYLNLTSWDNKLARYDLEAAVRREVRTEIFKPNTGDIPNALRGPFPKVFGMFYSFGFGMWNSVILPMAMNGKYGQLTTLVVATAAYEMLGETVRGLIRGDPYDLENPEHVEKLAFNALRKTPIISSLATGANIITLGQYGDYQVKSGTDLAASVIKGGSLSFAFDAFDALNSAAKVASGSRIMTQKEGRKMIKILPLQNNYFVRPLFNMFMSDLPKGK